MFSKQTDDVLTAAYDSNSNVSLRDDLNILQNRCRPVCRCDKCGGDQGWAVCGPRFVPPYVSSKPCGQPDLDYAASICGLRGCVRVGGRFNTCFHLTGARTNCLIDCGATSLVALKRLGIERNAIDLILITHFHADHFGGVPFFVLDAQFFSKRSRPLTIAGPID